MRTPHQGSSDERSILFGVWVDFFLNSWDHINAYNFSSYFFLPETPRPGAPNVHQTKIGNSHQGGILSTFLKDFQAFIFLYQLAFWKDALGFCLTSKPTSLFRHFYTFY